ncbi:hypothetical protein QJS04_geneDACA019463 [Acorus gramineus]|uniref:HNH nuclease domain-containing protein n=1 Tax=Acorus gramineus TaxID=55184 RepID=A0AAV9A8B5_ACOGR|nr:hypothetical protein QJS04_geneDACA019463 [Acorus gramineus]
MRPRNQRKRSASSPSRPRAPFEPSEPALGPTSGASPRAVSLEEAETAEREAEWGVFERNPRSFPYWVKQQCWDKAEKVKGRDPERWRRDPLGNLVFRKLVGCLGCLCHDYDHILPFSKGGKSTLENCQVLQAKVNRSKGNKTEISNADLIQKSAYCRVSGRDMDLLEMSAFGNVSRGEDSGGCRIQ